MKGPGLRERRHSNSATSLVLALIGTASPAFAAPALLAFDMRQDAPQPSKVELELVVTVPASTPADAIVHLSGNVAELGAWKPDAVKLERGEDGRHRARVSVARDARLEFKLTLGSWDRVERDARGADVANRRHHARADATLELTVATWGVKRRSTVLGTVERHERAEEGGPGFGERSDLLARPIHVWLPPGYAEQPELRCPVVYMQDGQNLFDAAIGFDGGEWQVDETCDRLIRAGEIPPLIVVGIENTPERMSEYTPVVGGRFHAGGEAAKYAKLVCDEVKPFVDARYRTRPERESTFIAGSSLGGLVSVYMVAKRSEVFGGAAALSPALTWGGDWMKREWERDPPQHPVRLWIDMGTREWGQTPLYPEAGTKTAEWQKGMDELAATLEREGLVRERDFTTRVIDGGRHNEAAWAARFDDVLRFLFAKPEGATAPKDREE